MSDKIIDEVMELIDVYVFDSEENALYINSGVDSEAGLALLKQKRHSRSAIRAKLREVLDRKPLNINVVHSLIPNLGERDAWDIEDMYTIARSVEKQHNIVS